MGFFCLSNLIGTRFFFFFEVDEGFLRTPTDTPRTEELAPRLLDPETGRHG